MSLSIKIEEGRSKDEEEKEKDVCGLGGEKRTGEEEEQRILLVTGGLVTVNSSKQDLFPHTMADIVSSSSSDLSLPLYRSNYIFSNPNFFSRS